VDTRRIEEAQDESKAQLRTIAVKTLVYLYNAYTDKIFNSSAQECQSVSLFHVTPTITLPQQVLKN